MASNTWILISSVVFSIVLILQRRGLFVNKQRTYGQFRTMDDNQVSLSLMKPLRTMLKIALPTMFCREGFFTMLFVALFGAQAFIHVLKTEADGKVVAGLLAVGQGRGSGAGRLRTAIGTFIGAALLEATVAGLIEHLRLFLITQYRAKLTKYFHKRYFSGLTFYHSAMLDDRIQNADTQITIYCHEFAEHFAELPYYFLLPLFEALAALVVIVRNVGAKSAVLMSSVVLVSLFALKRLQPPFGKIHEAEVCREEEFRRLHTDAMNNVEQLALHSAGGYTRRRLDTAFAHVQAVMEQFALARGHFTLIESSISGAIWDVAALFLCRSTLMSRFTKEKATAAVAGAAAAANNATGGGASSELLSSIIVQRKMLAAFNGAVKTFVVNSKEVSHLSEFTEKLADFENTLDSISKGRLMKKPDPRFIDSAGSFRQPTKDVLQITHCIQSPALMDLTDSDCFDDDTRSIADTLKETMQPIVVFDRVSLRTPSGVPLVKDLSFEIKVGESWVVTGPNGSGKSSVLRILAGMWLPYRGKVVLHPSVELFFLPQTPYFVAEATLIDQLFFPNSPEYGVGGILGRVQRAISSKYRSLAQEAMRLTCGSSIVSDVLGGWDSPYVGFQQDAADYTFDWYSLSGGQQQKLALARMFFNVALAQERGRIPLAIMDESTSQMDHDSEDVLFRNIRNKDIGCISVSHRDTVTKIHHKVLQLSHSDTYKIRSQRVVDDIDASDMPKLGGISLGTTMFPNPASGV